MSDRLTIQSATETPDGQGGASVTWATVAANIPAEQMPIGTSERIQAAGVSSTSDYRFRVRVRTDVTPQMRALFTPRWPSGASEQTLEIHGVLYQPDRAFMLLECGVRQ